ncbi:MAG: hypothetical protein WB608_20335 [Terracidiphilus sp.]
MNPFACPREKETAEVLRLNHWPHACPPDLRTHVEACRSCSDLVLLTQSFQHARASATAAAPLQSPGALWWRAQLRRRNAAIERIGKPILGAQIFAVAVTLLIAAGFIATQARRGLHWMSWLADLSASVHLADLWPVSLDNRLVLLVPVLATLALLGGVVVYLASEKQ